MSARRLCFIGWGDHVHTERWAGYFAQQGDDVSVISHTGPGQYPAGVQQVTVNARGRGPRWVEWRLRWLLWRMRPRLVHVHWAHFAVTARAAWRGPMIVTAWGSDIYRKDQFSATEWQQLGAALRASDLVTCDSEDLATTLREEFALPPDQVQVIQWGVDTNAFTPDGQDLRGRLNLGDSEIVLSARNFTPLYNQETVVRAFADLRSQRPRAKLLMKNYGGEANYVASIRALIRELDLQDAVHILESVPYDEMPLLYRTADVTLSIPHSDATPMSLLEAMACGSPCVVSDLPSLREWIQPGRTGFLVKPTDTAAITQAMAQALDPGPQRDVLRQTARQQVLASASQHAHMATAAAQYDRLISRR